MRAVNERVRVKKEGSRYHHGNLRDALVLAAERAIAKSQNVHLPLREVAKLAGVSHAAAYRHFDSKAALLAEVAVKGFAALTARITGAASKGRTPQARFVEAGVSYVSFALESPGAFRVMFDASLKPFTRFPGLSEAAFGALSELHRVLRAGVTAGVFRGDDLDGSVMTAWSTIHGHATLLLDEQFVGPFSVSSDGAVASARLVIRRLVDGLRVR